MFLVQTQLTAQQLTGNTEHQLNTEQKCFVALQPMLSYTSNDAPGIPTLNGLEMKCVLQS